MTIMVIFLASLEVKTTYKYTNYFYDIIVINLHFFSPYSFSFNDLCVYLWAIKTYG